MESDKARELRHSRTLSKLSKEELAEANAMKKGGMTMATKGVNPFAKFEKSGKDKETGKMGKEGSPKEGKFDKKQMMSSAMKCGGSVKKMATGGVTEGASANIDDDTRSRARAWMAKQAAEDDSGDRAPAAPSMPRRNPTRTPATAVRKAAPSNTSSAGSAIPAGGAYRGMRAATPTTAEQVSPSGITDDEEVVPPSAAPKYSYETPYDRLNRENREADAAERAAKLAKRSSSGTVQAYAKGGTVRGWGQARGARAAKIV